MYALIEFAGKQFKVEEGESIKVPYIDDKVGSNVTIDKILYLDDGKNKTVGDPLIKGIQINGEIESHVRGKKVVVFKFKRRKGYQKKNTHRQEYSMLKVGKIEKVKKVATKVIETKAASKKVITPKKATVKKTVSKKTTTKPKAVKKTVSKKATAKPKETKE